jgi:hypothetical protein
MSNQGSRESTYDDRDEITYNDNEDEIVVEDRRKVQTDGEIIDDSKEEKEESTLDYVNNRVTNLERGMERAMEQVDTTFTTVGNEMGSHNSCG